MAPHHSRNSARCQLAEALQGNRLGESPRDISLPKGWRPQGRKGSLDNQAMWIPLPGIRFKVAGSDAPHLAGNATGERC